MSPPEPYKFRFEAQILKAICAVVLAIILPAGLWPFHAPRNQISWVTRGGGIQFGKHGSIVSADVFEAPEPKLGNGCSLEIWLEPSKLYGSGTILAFYSPVRQAASFWMYQYKDGVEIQERNLSRVNRRARIYVPNVFTGYKPAFVAISAGTQGTAIYVDGTLLRQSSTFAISSRDLTGRLVAGNAASSSSSWSGQLKGLALYNREFSAAEVARHFQDWTETKPPAVAKNEGAVARYLFDEGSGGVIHNQLDSTTDLLIPERFFVLHKPFLERPWDEFRPDWNYVKDIGVNIAGFIPLGFFFYAYFSKIGKIKRAALLTVALGFVVSLTIEVLQAFLPTRDSGMTDLITNTFGAAVGTILCVWMLKHDWFTRSGYLDITTTQQNLTVRGVSGSALRASN